MELTKTGKRTQQWTLKWMQNISKNIISIHLKIEEKDYYNKEIIFGLTLKNILIHNKFLDKLKNRSIRRRSV
jgi:hypothetical protein